MFKSKILYCNTIFVLKGKNLFEKVSRSKYNFDYDSLVNSEY